MTERRDEEISQETRFRERFARYFILSAFAVTCYLVFRIFEPFLSGLAWALFLTSAFYPVYARLVSWSRGREWGAAILTTTLIASLIVVPTFFMFSTLVETLASFLEKAATAQPDASQTGVSQLASLLAQLDRLEQTIGRFVPLPNFKIHDTIISSLTRLGQTLAGQTQPLVENAFRTVVGFAVMVFSMAVLFRHGNRIVTFVRRNLPIRASDKDVVFDRIYQVARAIFYGVMLTAVVQSILGGIGWLIVSLPNPLFFGTAMFFCALIPIGGTALIWFPGAMYLFMQGSVTRGVILLLWGFLVVGMADNIIRPIFISGRTRIHILLVFFGIFGGLTAFGLKGLFLGPLVIALFFFLLEVVRRDLFQSESVK